MEALTAKDVMSVPVMAVRENITLEEVCSRLSSAGVSGAPVVDEAGNLLGVVSLADVVHALGENGRVRTESGSELTVRRMMTPMAETIAEDATIPDIARLMVANQYHRLVVVRRHRPVGMVSSMDILKLIAEMY